MSGPASPSASLQAGAADPYFAAMDKGLLLPPAAGAPYPKEIMEVAR